MIFFFFKFYRIQNLKTLISSFSIIFIVILGTGRYTVHNQVEQAPPHASFSSLPSLLRESVSSLPFNPLTMVDAVEWKFKAEWYDERSGLTKDFVLTYFINADDDNENEVSLFDIKARRVFLKRTLCKSIKKEQLFIGSKVVVYSRQLKIVEYADKQTRLALGTGQRTLVCDIPSTAYKHLGSILGVIHQNGFVLTKLKSVSHGPGHSPAFFVLCEVIGKASNEAQSPWHQLFKDSQAQGTKDVQVMEASEESDRIFATQTSTATFDNCSLLVVKSHAVKEGLAGEILSAIINAQFQISALELFSLSRSEAENFTEVYKGVLNPHEYTGLVTEFCSGSLLAVEVRGENCVQMLRQTCGPHDVEVAKALRPDSIRARFGSTTVQNAVHCTDLPEDGVLESQYFFEILMGTKNNA